MPGAEPRCRDGYKRASHNVGIIGARPWPAPAADLPFNSVRLRRTALRYFGIEPLCCTCVKRLARISRMSPTLLCYTERFRARWRQRVHCEGRSSRRGCAGAPRGSTSPLVEPVTAATGSCPDAGCAWVLTQALQRQLPDRHRNVAKATLPRAPLHLGNVVFGELNGASTTPAAGARSRLCARRPRRHRS